MTGELPFISIVVPTRDRPAQLAACLRSLAVQTYPRSRFEVIVVDDGGSAALDDVLAGVREQIDTTLMTQSSSGPGLARNAGAEIARGQFLAFTDDDCEPRPDWLENLAARLTAAPPGTAIGGRTVNALTDNACSAASQVIVDVLYAYYNSGHTDGRFFTTNNLALSADDFRTIGGFDPRFRHASEDRDLCDRWLAHGFRMTYTPECLVRHAHRLGLRSFWRQHFAYGRGASVFRQARARRGLPGIRPDPALHLRFLAHPFRYERLLPAFHQVSLVLLAQVATLAGYLRERARRHKKSGQ